VRYVLHPFTQPPTPRFCQYDIETTVLTQDVSQDWDIWRDGCPGGESPADVTHRLDALIASLRSKYHAGKFGSDGRPNDVLIVAHGHILRAFAARWVGKRLEDNPSLILEAGGVGTLRYVYGVGEGLGDETREGRGDGRDVEGMKANEMAVTNTTASTNRRYYWVVRLWWM
jgi:broad specificity phosphatase PhoE